MSEDASFVNKTVTFQDGDIVWVKLGTTWWPGEVKDQNNLPNDVEFKSPPLFIVKFFEEDSYEYVKTEQNIFPYSCERKNEFIKKGMASFRSKAPHMQKFPKDVSLAEVKTGGNANILSEPIFLPEKRRNYAEDFGTPSPKKTPKSMEKKRKASSKKNVMSHITHRRFLGYNDYEAQICIQYPGKDIVGDTEEYEEIVRINKEPTQLFRCQTCNYVTKRLEVFILHTKSHIQGVYNSVPSTKKSRKPTVKKPRKEKRKSNIILDSASSSDELQSPKTNKRKSTTSTSPKKSKQKKVESPPIPDIRNDLLAEWDDSEEDEEFEQTLESSISSKIENQTKDDFEINEISTIDPEAKDNEDDCKEKSEIEELTANEDQEKESEISDIPPLKITESQDIRKDIKSCFDFDEEEEETPIVETLVGRKIPRVIPPSDKRRSSDFDGMDILNSSVNPIEELDETDREETLKTSESFTVPPETDEKDEEHNKTFKELLESTAVPLLSEMENTLKCEQNFHETKTIKFPDKTEPTESSPVMFSKSESNTDKSASEVATKLTNPKKRFVKSFEDFELFQNEQRRKAEEEHNDSKTEEKKVEQSDDGDLLKISNLKTRIMTKIQDQQQEDEKLKSTSKELFFPNRRKSNTHQSPRNKFLESYNNETKEKEELILQKENDSNQVAIAERLGLDTLITDDKKSRRNSTEKPTTSNKDIYPPKKKIWPRRRSSARHESLTEDDKSEALETGQCDSDSGVKCDHKQTPHAKLIKQCDEPVSDRKEIVNNLYEAVVTNSESSKESPPCDDSSSVSNQNIPENQSFQEVLQISTDLETKEMFSKKESDVFSVIETSAVLPDDAICSPVKKTLSDSDKLEETGIDEDLDLKTDEANLEEKQEDIQPVTADIDPIVETPNSVPDFQNESTLSKDEKLSALTLASLATASAPNLASLATTSSSSIHTDPIKEIAITSETRPAIPPSSDTVEIDEVNLKVVSEKELAEGEVEITALASNNKKPVTLQTFSMDFSESTSDSNSTNEIHDILETDSSNSELMKSIKEDSKPQNNKPPTTSKYEQFELLDILEGNSRTPEPVVKPVAAPVKPMPNFSSDILDFEDHIPSQVVMTKNSTASEDLDDVLKTTTKISDGKKKESIDMAKISQSINKSLSAAQKMGKTKFVIKPSTPALKQTITSEKHSKVPSNKPIKRSYDDIEDMEEAFIIPKTLKKSDSEEQGSSKSGKAKILQQTIITPEGNILQPKVSKAEDQVFDINSMPIVLSDEILTPDNIVDMPIVLDESSTKIIPKTTVKPRPKIFSQNKILSPTIQSKSPTSAIIRPPTKLIKAAKFVQSSPTITPKLIKQSSILPSSAKGNNKYIIMPQTSSSQIKGKKPTIIKRPVQQSSTLQKMQTIGSETTGNKIMIVTNQQGEQQRLVLTPADQKRLGCASKITTKPLIKGNYVQKTILNKNAILDAGPSGLTRTIRSIQSTGNKVHLGTISSQVISQGQSLASVQSKQVKSTVLGNKLILNKPQKPYVRQKTILIKNQHGQTVKTIQGTDDELLDKQVAEQLEAIKASNALRLQQLQKQEQIKSSIRTPIKKSYVKKISTTKEPVKPHSPLSTASLLQTTDTTAVPPLTPISNKKVETESISAPVSTESPTTDRPLNQLVIQDALGNQTTITEGQILALPSETVDGQPQSYMLVTLDESGTLTPLNSEAIMSLDPNLLAGGDLSNMMLQIDQGTPTVVESPPKTTEPKENTATTTDVTPTELKPDVTETILENSGNVENAETPQPTSSSTETGQQLIVTGDPIATQKFLESLTEGTTDLANILANAEGSSILIQADGQQILINTNADNQVLVSVNNDNLSSESGGNPMFANQPSNKNQDILAAALADTDVFQQDQSTSQAKLPSQLSPGSTLYPMNVSNVLETSLTLNSPIMTPLEVPSSNSKKIPDEEAVILTQVPKNVSLPITITDPNISQTVSQQQVALLAGDLQTNLELNLPISEATISVSASEMNSPSFVYSLPTLDDINQKPFNSSMPLLTEDVDESSSNTVHTTETGLIEETITEEEVVKDNDKIKEETIESTVSSPKDAISDSNGDSSKKDVISSVDGFVEDEEEGLCTLGGEMCSSLSEPPPDMFDLPAGNFMNNDSKSDSISSNIVGNEEEITENSTIESNSPTVVSEDSCEIPVQPPIITELSTDSNSSAKLSTTTNEESEHC